MDLYDLDPVANTYRKGGYRLETALRDEGLKERLKHFIDYAERVPLRTVLDVGCGAGAITHEVSKIIGQNDAMYVGVDVSAKQIDNARLDFASAENITFAVSAGDHLPFADGAFEIVYENAALCWAKSPGQFIVEMFRVSNGLVSFGVNVTSVPTARASYGCVFKMVKKVESKIELQFNPTDYGMTEVFPDYMFPIPGTDLCQYPVWIQRIGTIPIDEYSEFANDGNLQVLHEKTMQVRNLGVARSKDVDGPPMRGDRFYEEYVSNRTLVALKA